MTSRDATPYDEGVEVKDVSTGFIGVAHHGNGTSSKTWMPTEDEAREAAQDALKHE